MDAKLNEEIIEQFIEEALLESFDVHPTRSEAVVGITTNELRREAEYLKGFISVKSSKEIEKLVKEERLDITNEYISYSSMYSNDWDHMYGSIVNDQFYFLSIIKFNDKITKLIFSETNKVLFPESNNDESKLTHAQIAMLCFFDKKPITANNSKDIASKYGYVNKTSGQKLFDTYRIILKDSNRKNSKNAIKNYEAILDLLENDKGKAEAGKELQQLKSKQT
ncbi:hypothetical protein [Larkinella humicola]|uniref:Uncharacterized protein n=1 Tax=Larkinella humicola TaxID=2607654 RepID=A0A5N1JEP7_9BACT|nr:hypothetical protein [Larkinella humicola]KAA9349576.1 hypothetical protein F0P93_19120 [Larkinella humicola]